MRKREGRENKEEGALDDFHAGGLKFEVATGCPCIVHWLSGQLVIASGQSG